MNKLMCLCCIFFTACLAIQSNAYSGEKIKFGTFPIPRMVEDEKNGIFVELTHAMAQRANLDIEILVFPPKRTWVHFRKNKINVIFPAFDVNFLPDKHSGQPTQSTPFSAKPDYVFTRKGRPLLKTIKDLEGKKVGVTLGYPYVKELIENPLIEIDSAHYDELGAKMLVSGRIDAFVISLKTGLDTFKKLGVLDQVQYDIETPLSVHEFYYACHSTEQGKKLCKSISNALDEMREGGILQKFQERMQEMPK